VVSKVGSVTAGLVKLSGRASSDAPEKGPISGTSCAYWKITAEYYRSSGRSANWYRFYDGISVMRFYLKDETGRIHIDPDGSNMDIWEESHQGYISVHGLLSHGEPDMDESVMNFIRSLDRENAEKFKQHGKSVIRVTEHNIGNNEPLYIMGSAGLFRNGLDAEPGEIFEIRKGDHGEPLYISNKSEHQFVRKFSFRMYLKIFGGLAICAAALICGLSLPSLEAQGVDAIAFIATFSVALAYAVYIAKEHRQEVF